MLSKAFLTVNSKFKNKVEERKSQLVGTKVYHGLGYL